MSGSLQELEDIIHEVESTPFDELEDIDDIVKQLFNRLLTEDDVLRAAEVLGRADLDVLRVELIEVMIGIVRSSPLHWESFQQSVKTLIIFERFLGNF